jgi:hypothetical protein
MLRQISLALVLVLATATVAAAQEATPPRVAVWDPVFGASNEQVPINPDLLEATAERIEQTGVPVKRLRVDQINDEKQFSAKTVDVLFMPGEGYPLSMTPGLKKFITGGGVIVSLEGKLPLTVPLVPDVNGKWQVLPSAEAKGPNSELLSLYGLETFPYATQGQTFEATPTLIRYLSEASDINLGLMTSYAMPRPSAKATGIRLLPLLRLADSKGAVRPSPLIFFEKRGTGPARGLIAANWSWLFEPGNKNGWTVGPSLTKALADLAADWRAGRFKLTGEDVLDIDAIRKARAKSGGK